MGRQALDRQVTIPLLGRHQVANVSAALAAVHTLGYASMLRSPPQRRWRRWNIASS